MQMAARPLQPIERTNIYTKCNLSPYKECPLESQFRLESNPSLGSQVAILHLEFSMQLI